MNHQRSVTIRLVAGVISSVGYTTSLVAILLRSIWPNAAQGAPVASIEPAEPTPRRKKRHSAPPSIARSSSSRTTIEHSVPSIFVHPESPNHTAHSRRVSFHENCSQPPSSASSRKSLFPSRRLTVTEEDIVNSDMFSVGCASASPTASCSSSFYGGSETTLVTTPDEYNCGTPGASSSRLPAARRANTMPTMMELHEPSRESTQYFGGLLDLVHKKTKRTASPRLSKGELPDSSSGSSSSTSSRSSARDTLFVRRSSPQPIIRPAVDEHGYLGVDCTPASSMYGTPPSHPPSPAPSRPSSPSYFSFKRRESRSRSQTPPLRTSTYSGGPYISTQRHTPWREALM